MRKWERPRLGSLSLFVVIVAVLSVAVLLLVLFADHLELSIDNDHAATWAQVLQGVATVAAVAVALRGISIERRQARRDRAEQRDAQATQVFAWLAPHSGEAGRRRWYLRFENHTGVPVYEWQVSFGEGVDHVCGDRLGPLRPNGSELLVPALTGLPHSRTPHPVLYFVDVNERVWMRDKRGRTARQERLPPCCAESTESTIEERLPGWTG